MREESGKTHETPFQASDQALDEDLVLELGLRGGGLRLAVEVIDHVARHEEGKAGQHDGAEEEHLHERVSSNFMAADDSADEFANNIFDCTAGGLYKAIVQLCSASQEI